jgi:hypothetical protein
MQLDPETPDEKITLNRRLAHVKMLLDEDWTAIQQLYLITYSGDPRRAESIASIIRHYHSTCEWNTAYLFSGFARKTFQFKNPRVEGALETEDTLYNWELLLYHFISCFNSGRKEEAAVVRRELKILMHDHPEIFSLRDLVHIRANSPLFLTLRNFRRRINGSHRRRKKGLVSL